MQVFEVGQITQRIQKALHTDALLRGFWVRGEIANLSRSASGHYYFALSDQSAQLRAVLFSSNASRAGIEPRNGETVVAYGELEFYEPNGSLSVRVRMLYPEGTGIAQLEFEALKLRLEAEGLFDPTRKRRLPGFPRRIGIVTSDGGAVLHDIVNVMARRYPLVELVLAHASVQGERAPGEICAALAALARHSASRPLDLIIVARGGGDPTELAVFNDEGVARAIFACPVPVVSAVGHEVDVTIADLVADLRAPTPSAAAEMVAPDVRDLRLQVAKLTQRGSVAVHWLLRRASQALEERRTRLTLCSPDAQIGRRRLATQQLLRRGESALVAHIGTAREQLKGRELQLQALSPLQTLERGYAICVVDGQSVLRSVESAPPGEQIDITLSDGVVGARAERRQRAAGMHERQSAIV